jgi:urocanate hydratase
VTLEPIAFDSLNFALAVERFYNALVEEADAEASSRNPLSSIELEPGLGGKLLYAGALDEVGRALVVAGNIAGAASLIASPDPAAQKQAVRDGVVDFLVTSLDEALRILKNEIRKHETVAVCVAAVPDDLQWEMLERGVLPDLLRPEDEFSAHSPFVAQGAHRLEPLWPGIDSIRLQWRVVEAPAVWLPKLDVIALECLKPEAWSERRWVRLAPRYLGRLASGFRCLLCDHKVTANFMENVRERTDRGEIGVPVEVQVTGQGHCDPHWFSPHGEA